ncbi:MAG: HAMP domain-containing histidine kinase, partial [Clostridiales Family XIII bacterium]|nr:HAMP domain-containing histidine kinase [Clostridiales Family XIII bacterium]
VCGAPVLLTGVVVVLRSGLMREGITRLYVAATVFSLFTYTSFLWGIPNFAPVWNFVFLIINSLLMSDRYAKTQQSEEKLAVHNERLDKLNRAKTEFLQDMSHEMKSPLTVIATGIDFADREIHKESADMERTAAALDSIREETQRLGRMVGGMVNLASMSEISENRKRVDFAALLRNSAEAFRLALERRNNRLSVEIAPGLPDVFMENDRFKQVLSNLFSNAAEHTENGKIVIAADCDGTFITVRVADTGEGIAPELLPDVFKRGVSGRGGTGYGLYICKTVVEAHGGTIKIESAPGKGTAVTFTIPIYGGQEAGHTL